MEASYEAPEDCESSCALPSRIMVSSCSEVLQCCSADVSIACLQTPSVLAKWGCSPVTPCHDAACMTGFSPFLGPMHRGGLAAERLGLQLQEELQLKEPQKDTLGSEGKAILCTLEPLRLRCLSAVGQLLVRPCLCFVIVLCRQRVADCFVNAAMPCCWLPVAVERHLWPALPSLATSKPCA